MHTRTQPALLWRSDVQSLTNSLRRQVAAKVLQHREALEVAEEALKQRDEARCERDQAIAGWQEESRLCGDAIRQRDSWMQLARDEAERADQAQPMLPCESRAWTLAGMLMLIGAGVVLGLRMGGKL